MSNLPESFCIDIVAEKEHKRLQEFKKWCNNIAFPDSDDIDDSFGFESRFYGKNNDRFVEFQNNQFGELLTLDRFFELLDPKTYTISDLANGVCAVENDGTLKELQKVIGSSFPNAPKPFNNYVYYFSKPHMDGYWEKSNNAPDLPTQSVKLFLQQLEKPEPIKANQHGVLPENWRVKPKTHEQYMTLAKWRGSEPKSNWENVWMLSLKTWVTDDYINMVYHTEITFEQFKKHVMNKPEPITSINVGDEFMCVEDVACQYRDAIYYKKGRVYKSEVNGRITDEFNDINHMWASNEFPLPINEKLQRHFIRHQPTKEEVKDSLGKVDVSEFELQLNEVLDNVKSILLNKNRKYGDAALNPLKIFSKGGV